MTTSQRIADLNIQIETTSRSNREASMKFTAFLQLYQSCILGHDHVDADKYRMEMHTQLDIQLDTIAELQRLSDAMHAAVRQ